MANQAHAARTGFAMQHSYGKCAPEEAPEAIPLSTDLFGPTCPRLKNGLHYSQDGLRNGLLARRGVEGCTGF